MNCIDWLMTICCGSFDIGAKTSEISQIKKNIDCAEKRVAPSF